MNASVFHHFAQQNNLSDQQKNQFKLYEEFLLQENKKFNLTALENSAEVILYHFQDSLALASCMDMLSIFSLLDVGSGGGFPGIPLKILFPHLGLYLLEVQEKKVQFLQQACSLLELEQSQVIPLDWRTFLRTSQYSIDCIIARASLRPDELIRMFQPTSAYKNAHLVYWASQQWQPGPKEQKYLERQCSYTVGNKLRKLVFFKKI